MPRTRGDCVAARGAALGSNYSSAIARYGREQGASVAWARLLRRGRGRRGPRAPPGGGCDEDDRVKFIVKCAVIFAILHTDVRRGCKIYILQNVKVPGHFTVKSRTLGARGPRRLRL